MDDINHADVIRDLDLTVIRGPMLTDDPANGASRVGYVGKVAGWRADLADFILKEFSRQNHIHDMPFVTNG